MLRFDAFLGASIARHPLELPAGIGVASVNSRPGRGDLRGWLGLSSVATVPSSRLALYRMGRGTLSDTLYWLTFTTLAEVARGFIADDATERTFWTDGTAPKWTDNSIGLGSSPYPDSSGVRLLGVPYPNAAPTLAQQVAGTGTDESRAYVTTWVNDRGEESQPSTAATITCKPGATIRVTRNASVPGGNWGLSTWRAYRTVEGSGSDYFFFGEASAATAYIDESGSFDATKTLKSLLWAQPQNAMRGLKLLWNGMMAGFVGKSVVLCQPYLPFAWPTAYSIPVEDDIVALARWGSNLLVLTKGHPWLLTGSSPASMLPRALDMPLNCLSSIGVVEFSHGVAWPSRDGLAYCGDPGTRLLTNPDLALPEDWRANFYPDTMVGGRYQGLYIGSFDNGSTRKSLILDPLNPGDGLRVADPGFTAAHYDTFADQLFVLNGTSVQKWNAGSQLVASFTSGIALAPAATTYRFAQVIADVYPVTLTVNGNGVSRPAGASVASAKPFRLPDGPKATQWQVIVSTTSGGGVQAVRLAHSIRELNGRD